MISIVSHAQPAELVTTLRASHVHAPFIFLYLGFTFWTGLGIELYPFLICVITQACLVQPFLKQITRNRSVSTTTTFKAPIMPTIAYNICLFHWWIVNGASALRCWTPLCPLVHPDESVLVVFLVTFVLLVIKQLLEEFLIDKQFAGMYRALGEDYLGAISHLCLQVLLETVAAETMRTF